MSYVIAELKTSETCGGFAPRGAVRKLWGGREFETIVSGPAETGKTWGCLQYVDALLWKYPGAQGILARKVYSTLVGSAVRTLKRIVGENSPVIAYGGEKPQWFDYPNGSRLWLAGMDNPGKALSSERDFIYVNQAEELRVDDWQTLMTRCTGRGAVMPYTRIFGDCNPGAPSHWIKQREAEGSLLLLESRHTDNPTLYDDAGNQTDQGKRTMAVLDAMSGVIRLRLRDGKWAQAEGVVYENYDTAVHLIDRIDIPADWRRIRAIDFGYTNPFVCQWWALDGDGRMYLYREIYRTKRLVQEHAAEINRLSGSERYETTVADHDAEDRATLDHYGISTIPAMKSVSPGIQAVTERLKIAGDKRARMFVMRDALVEADPALTAVKKPHCTAQEFEVYSWPKGKDGKPRKEEPVKEHDHGMDTMRYAVAYVDAVGSGTLDVRLLGDSAPQSIPVNDRGWHQIA